MLSLNTWALDGTGTIDEIKMCHSGDANGWKGYILFKLSDSNWFGLHADYIASAATDYDSSIEVGLVITAFSQSLNVNVRANYGGELYNYCGHNVALFWNTTGDYIHIIK